MKKGQILENVTIEKLVFWGKWFAKHESGKTIFVTGGAIPGSIVDLKVIKKRTGYVMTQIVNTVKKSPIEKKHPNNPWGETWWCKWVNIPYEEQLKIKQEQIVESFFHLEKYQKDITFEPIVPSPLVDGYRNKAEFSFGKHISAKNNIEEHFNVWFHKQGMFSQIEDFDGCILTDKLVNDVYLDIKTFAKASWLPVYDQKWHTGFFRHIIFRRAFFTDEMMVILSFNPHYNDWDIDLDMIKEYFKWLAERFWEIKSIYLSHNDNKADTAIWRLELIHGKETVDETILWLTFEISPKSFFQTNSHWAEVLYSKVVEFANKDNIESWTVLDLYAGTGTIGMIFSKFAKHVTSVELVESATENGKKNAVKNSITNIDFVNAKVEDFLWKYLETGEKADLLIIDPPRAGMHPKALPNIMKFESKQIIYVSCNPATLSRDLEEIIKDGEYSIEKVCAVDMFPHTHHIEVVVSLVRD